MRGNGGKDKGYSIKKINEDGWQQLNSTKKLKNCSSEI